MYFTTASWGPFKKKKNNPGALGTCPLVKTALFYTVVMLLTFILINNLYSSTTQQTDIIIISIPSPLPLSPQA